MTEKELFEIALKYVEKGYSSEDLKYGDDLYDANTEDKNHCIECYVQIKHEGSKWAYEYLETLN